MLIGDVKPALAAHRLRTRLSFRAACEVRVCHCRLSLSLMDHAHDNPRRRDGRSRSPVGSSSDDLAAGLDREQAKHRRTSWTMQNNSTPPRSSHQGRRYSESESADESGADSDEYWRRSRNRRSRSPINRPYDLSNHPDRSHESDRRSEDHTPRRGNMSDRSPTPVAPAPRPKPDHLDYREKFVLHGHLRGVSAVQFSPDCSMIASGGMAFLSRPLVNLF